MTTPMQDYIGEHGGPDREASARLEAWLGSSMSRGERKGAGPWLAVVLAAAAIVLVVGGVVWRQGPAPGGPTELVASHAGTIELNHGGRARFEDGTRLAVAESAGGGARIDLRAGTVELDVNHVDGVDWVVESGDYAVRAIGTRFRVKHTGGEPTVDVFEGRVRVVGPTLPAEGRVVGAQPTVMPAGAEPVRTPEEPPEPDPVPEPESEPEPDPQPDSEPESPDPPAVAPPGWLERVREALAQDDARAAVASLPRGFPTQSQLRRLGSGPSLRVADALRAQEDANRAVAVYGAVCRVWPGRADCGLALFRHALEEGRRGHYDRAIDLVTRYLERDSNAPLAQEAVGRRMLWHARTGNGPAARKDAQTYLRRWPDGARASRARQISTGGG